MEPERQPPAVETTAYVTVAEAIEDAARRGASFLAVTRRPRRPIASSSRPRTTARPRSSRLLHLADRVGALGGSLEVGDHTLRAEIPCE